MIHLFENPFCRNTFEETIDQSVGEHTLLMNALSPERSTSGIKIRPVRLYDQAQELDYLDGAQTEDPASDDLTSELSSLAEVVPIENARSSSHYIGLLQELDGRVI